MTGAWFRFYDSILDDERYGMLSDSAWRTLVELKAWVARQKDPDGNTQKSPSALGWLLRRKEGVIEADLDELEERGLIRLEDGLVIINEWVGLQYGRAGGAGGGTGRIPKTSTERSREYRARQREKAAAMEISNHQTSGVASTTCNVAATLHSLQGQYGVAGGVAGNIADVAPCNGEIVAAMPVMAISGIGDKGPNHNQHAENKEKIIEKSEIPTSVSPSNGDATLQQRDATTATPLDPEVEREEEKEKKEEREAKAALSHVAPNVANSSGHAPLGFVLPKNWEMPAEWIEWAFEARPDFSYEIMSVVSRNFHDHYVGEAITRRDWESWFSAWKKWVRNEQRSRKALTITTVNHATGQEKVTDYDLPTVQYGRG